MAFEREAISNASTPMDNSSLSTPLMKEERVVSPYVPKNQLSGQPSINKETAEPPPTEESVKLTPQVAALARKEQKFRQQMQELKQKELKLESERAEIADLKALKAKLQQKDLSGIEDLIPYDDYTNYLIDKTSSLSPEQQALKKLESEFEGLKKSQTEDVEKRFEAAVQQRRTAVKELLDSSTEFPKVKKANFEEHVLQYILDTWEHDNVDLSPQQAAKEVEQILEEKAKKWAELLNEETPNTQESQKQLPPLKSSIKTITNNMTVTGDVKRAPRSYQGMSDSERYAEARRRAEEKLSKGLI